MKLEELFIEQEPWILEEYRQVNWDAFYGIQTRRDTQKISRFISNRRHSFTSAIVTFSLSKKNVLILILYDDFSRLWPNRTHNSRPRMIVFFFQTQFYCSIHNRNHAILMKKRLLPVFDNFDLNSDMIF